MSLINILKNKTVNTYVDVSRFHMNKHEKLLQQLCQVRITFYFSSLTPNPRNSSLCESGIASDGGKNQQIRNTAVATIVTNKGMTIFSQWEKVLAFDMYLNVLLLLLYQYNHGEIWKKCFQWFADVLVDCMFKKILRCSSPQCNEGYQSGSIISDISIGSFQHAESRWRGLAIFEGTSTIALLWQPNKCS